VALSGYTLQVRSFLRKYAGFTLLSLKQKTSPKQKLFSSDSIIHITTHYQIFNKCCILHTFFIVLNQITDMTLRHFITSLIFLFSVTTLSAQDTLLLLNGKTKPVKLFNLNDPDWVRYVKLQGSSRVKKVDIYKVFSIKKADGTEQVLYKPDSTSDDPDIPWVRDFIAGQQYGILHKRERFNKHDNQWHRRLNFTEVGGIAAGGAGSLLTFYGIPVPAIYAIAVGRHSPALPNAPDISPEMKNSEGFISGYQKQRRNQRIRQGFISGMIGFAVGIVTFTLIERN